MREIPFVMIVDDDDHFNKFIQTALKRFGIEGEFFKTPESFLIRLKERKPCLCLVDLNIGQLKVGFSLVKAVRKVFGPTFPLLVVSLASDRQSITHAIELGASDYLVKPVDLEMLASKLQNYIQSKEITADTLPFFPVPSGGSEATAELVFEIHEIDECGIRLFSKHLLNKGTALEIEGGFISELNIKSDSILVNVTSTWTEDSCGLYGVYGEFDPMNERLLKAVRLWLSKKKSE